MGKSRAAEEHSDCIEINSLSKEEWGSLFSANENPFKEDIYKKITIPRGNGHVHRHKCLKYNA